MLLKIMADNLPNIKLPVNEWVDLYALSGIAPGTSLGVENIGSCDIYLAVQDTQPAVSHDAYNVVQRDNGIRLQNAIGSSGAWAYCNAAGGKVAVGVAWQDGFYPPQGDGGGGGDSGSGIIGGNSSSDPLGVDEIFVGEWVDITAYGIVYVSVYSDVISAEDGLMVQQSVDGVNADHSDEYTIPAAIGKNFAINPHAKYFRVAYINGASPQTEFRLQVKANQDGLSSSHRVKGDITTDDDSVLTKSILAIKANDQNQYKNIELNNPMPVNTDQLYQSDINIEFSDMGNFSGEAIDIAKDRWSPIVDSTANNPKYLGLEFERPIQTSLIGVTAAEGSFSNTIIRYGLTTSPSYTLVDESTDSTAKTLLIAPSTPITLTRIEFEFHTANTVTLTGINLARASQTISQIQGIDPDGELLTIGSTRLGNLKASIQEYGDTPSIDSFDRLRVAEPFTIFDSKQLYDKQPLLWSEALGGAATSVHSTLNAATTMTVTANAADYAIRQTKQRFNYQPGKSQLFFLTFLCECVAGVTKRIGCFDGTGANSLTPNNGIFVQTDAAPSWNIAKGGTITESAPQTGWNVDTLDGSGDGNNPSGIQIDFDAAQIAIIDFEWLGVGRVRVGFVIDGIIRYVHKFNHANDPTFKSVYMSTPNLPIRYDIQTDGTAGSSLDHICGTVISEGGVELTGISRSIDTQNVPLDANAADTTYVCLAIRLKTTHLDLTVLPRAMTMICGTNDDFKWSLLVNPTYAGTLTYSDIEDSGCQRAAGTTANTISADGVKLASGYAQSNGSISADIVNNLRIGSQIDGTRDEIILAVTPITSNADIHASLMFRELL